MSQHYQHWKIETDPTGIAWLHLDKAKSNTNVLSAAILNEFSDILDELEKKIPRAVVILSDKERLYRRRRCQGIHHFRKRRRRITGHSPRAHHL
jgi:hypothetical protein